MADPQTQTPEESGNGDTERKLAILDKHCIQLSEHFDSVQIIATQFSPDSGTRIISKGFGNWYANVGAVSDWLDSKREETRRQVGDD